VAEDLKYFAAAAVLFCLLDYLWLGVIAKKFYRDNLAALLAAKPKLMVAAGFYGLFIVGLLVFVVVPAARAAHPAEQAFRLGALYGFFTYATYDLTNLATLKNWPAKLALVDIAWGAVLSCAVAGLTVLLI
jgi:uncharacterized membrane protein